MLFSYSSLHEMMLCQWLYTSDKSISRLLNSMVRWSSRYWQPEERWRRSTYKLEFSITLVLQYALFIKFRSDQKSMKMIWTNDKPSLWSGDCDHLHGLEICCYDQSISSVISKTCVAESWNTRLVSIAFAEIVWLLSYQNGSALVLRLRLAISSYSLIYFSS